MNMVRNLAIALAPLKARARLKWVRPKKDFFVDRTLCVNQQCSLIEDKMVKKTIGFVFITLVSFSTFAAEKSLQKSIIVGVFDFSSATPATKVAEAAEKLKKSDSNFSSIIVAEIHKDTYGIYFIYRSNKNIDTPDKLTEMAKPLFADFKEHYEGQHISNSTITVK